MKSRRKAHQRRPDSLVNERDLSPNEAADENVLGVANRAGDLEDEVALRMRPPTTANGRARDRFGQRRHRALG
jgi:hypothetical protein